MALRFAGVELDVDAMTLRRDGATVPVEPQVFDVIAHLVTHRDRMVPRVELLDEVWGDRFVSDSALSSRIKSARRALGDNGRDQRLIRTVHGRGFRFVGEVHDDTADHAEHAPGGPGGEEAAAGVAEVLDAVRARTGAAVAVVSTRRAHRTSRLDDLESAATDADLLVGRGDGGVLRGRGPVLDAIDEWLRRRPSLWDELPSGCRDELAGALDGRGPTTPQRLRLCLTEVVAAADRSGGALLLVDELHLCDRPTVELLGLLARSARRRGVVVAVGQRAGAPLAAGFTLVDLDDADMPRPDDRVDDRVADGVADELHDLLAGVAALGPACSFDEFASVCALSGADPARALGAAVASGAVEDHAGSLCFTDEAFRSELEASVTQDRRDQVRRSAAVALRDSGAPPQVVAQRLLDAGRLDDAGPLLLEAAHLAAAAGLHGEVIALTDRVDELGDHVVRAGLVELRADALTAVGDSEGIRRYREVLRTAPPDRVNWLRARLGRAHLFASDLEGASDALAGVEPDGGDHDGAILLILGTLEYFRDDLDEAERRLDAARPLAFAPGASEQMLDTIALQGMIAHSRGEWFDRLRRELRVAASSPELVGTVFDSHVCVAQYLLYGPTGHDDVLRLAADLRANAERLGSARAVGFAATLSGEARFLSGDLAGARRDLTESVELHRGLGAETGTAHAMQRLAEVDLADGERAAAESTARRALPLARWSPLSRHLLQRVYGTLIAAAPDPSAAVDARDEAMAVLDGPMACEFCQVMIDVPAAIACAAAGRLDEARAHLEEARRCAARWDGPAWPAAVDEAHAAVAVAEGDLATATQLLQRAADGYALAGQVLDEARCRESDPSDA